MASLKAILDNLDDAPESERGYYVEKNGKFVLDLVNVESHPNVLALQNAHNRTKESNKKLSDELKALKDKIAGLPDDFDPEEFTRIKAKLEEYEADPTKKPDKATADLTAARTMLEQKIANMEKKHANEIKAKDEIIAKKHAFITRLLVDDGLTKSLLEAGVKPSFMKAAKAMLREGVEVSEDDGEYEAVVQTDMGPVSIDKFVSDWASSDEGKEFIPAPKGGDAGGVTGGRNNARDEKNPWKKETWNLTEQGRIVRADRQKAERLAGLAGQKLAPAQ